MKKLAFFVSLWLLSTMTAAQAEVLNFRVYFGAIYAGKLWFTANTGEGSGYSIAATLEDALPWVTFNDKLLATGTLNKGRYVTQQYDLKLRENDYRADKVIAFDRKKNTATYTNRLDPKDPKVVLEAGPNVSDVLSTLWTLRQEPVANFSKPRKMQVLGLKSLIDLTVQAKGFETVTVKGKHAVDGIDGTKQKLMRIDLNVVDPKEPSKVDLWQIWVKPAAVPGEMMVPVVFATKTKLGRFWAYLQ